MPSFTEPFEQYFLDNYGSCQLGTKCRCLREDWKGQGCLHWIPLGVKSINEYRIHVENLIQEKKR